MSMLRGLEVQIEAAQHGRETKPRHCPPDERMMACALPTKLFQALHSSFVLAVLEKPDVVGVLLKAATADIEAVLANDADARTAGSAAARALSVALGM